MRSHASLLTLAFVLVAVPASARHRTARSAHTAPAPVATTAPAAFSNDVNTPGVGDGTPQSAQDVELEYHIESRFGRIAGLDSADVHVRSVRGAITLSGTVASARAHDQVLFAAASTDGVQVVRDELAVAPSARGGGPSGAPLADAVRAQLAGTPGVVGEPLQVDAQGGVLTLRGHVATYADAARVVQRAKQVPGVTAVRPDLTVNQSVIVDVDGDRNNARTVRAPAPQPTARR